MSTDYCVDEGCPHHGTKHVCLPAEQHRFDSLSNEKCPLCDVIMLVGELEAIGTCTSCCFMQESGAD